LSLVFDKQRLGDGPQVHGYKAATGLTDKIDIINLAG
jgi:hypothetical protein